MDIIESIIDYFKSDNKEDKAPSPKGICANCWGHQQYDGKIRTLLSDKQIDINNHQESYTIIQEFVTQNIDGIKLLEAEESKCPSCTIE